MDPRKLFVDERLIGRCVYCGADPETSDHCPSKVLLDEPFPSDLRVVDSCSSCNTGFSKDEQYLACLIECVVCGSADPNGVERPKIKRILSENPALAARIQSSQRLDESGNIIWEAEVNRVRNIVLKLAYELSLQHWDKPDQILFAPLMAMSRDQKEEFEIPWGLNSSLFPEIGSRAFMRAVGGGDKVFKDKDWIIVQPENYRYLVSQEDGDFVQIVLREYLACRVAWR
jgi:hypothetical protein